MRIAGEALRDAKKSKNGGLVHGDEKTGWLLSETGVEWIGANNEAVRELGVAPGPAVLTVTQRSTISQVERSRAFQNWKAGSPEIARFEIASAVGLPADAPPMAIANKLEGVRNTAQLGGYDNVREYIGWLLQQL